MTLTLEEPKNPEQPARGAGGPPNLAALKDGLRAMTYPLPQEAEAAARRAAVWHVFYKPESPAAIHLTNECARATIVADRAEKFRQARVERQKAYVPRNWRRRRRRLEATTKRMHEDRLGTLPELMSFSEGCHELANAMQEGIDGVRFRGYLLEEELENAIYYHEIWPVEELMHVDVTVYTFHTLNLACTPGVTPEQLDAWVEPANRPADLRGHSREQLIPGDPERCRERLIELLKARQDKFALEETKDDSIEDRGLDAAVPPSSMSGSQGVCQSPVPAAATTAGAGVVRNDPPAAAPASPRVATPGLPGGLLLLLLAFLVGRYFGALGWTASRAVVGPIQPWAASAPLAGWVSAAQPAIPKAFNVGWALPTMFPENRWAMPTLRGLERCDR
jgi:hypothetical protein